MEGVQQGPKGRGAVRPKGPKGVGYVFGQRQPGPVSPARGSGGALQAPPSEVRGVATATQRFSYILSALHGWRLLLHSMCFLH